MLLNTNRSRRDFLKQSAASSAALLAATPLATALAAKDDRTPPTARGFGDVETPEFYRYDIGTAPSRLHEPTAGSDGNIWTSPLDGNLWRYHAPSGKTEVIDLKKLTGQGWKGQHLWPVAAGNDVYLCCPNHPRFQVWHRDSQKVKQYAFPHERPSVYGGFVVPGWKHAYFYDIRHMSVLKWNLENFEGRNFPCPDKLSGPLYMSFAEPDRQEIWGSTYTGNDIVRFDVKQEKWTGHFRCPHPKSTPTAGQRVFGDTLYVSDHLNGRIFPLNVNTGKWGEPIAVPGYKEWFGYVSGGWHFRGKLYMCHSTWTGGTSSLDGKQHHFLGSWTVFDPATQKFSRLDLPTRKGEQLEYLMSDYCASYNEELYILAVNNNPPKNAIVLRSDRLS